MPLDSHPGSSGLGQGYTGYAFEFAVKIQTRSHKKRAALPIAVMSRHGRIAAVPRGKVHFEAWKEIR